MQSMAGYSLLCYFLQIKDRHNGNILLDSSGHMIHVDFGFLFSNSPGNLNFESQTFKLTSEYVEVLGGQRSKMFNKFRSLMVKGFMTLREHADEIIAFVEMTMISGIDLPCFVGKERVISSLRERFMLSLTHAECKQFVLKMIEDATDNWRTRWYDKYQQLTVGIFQ
jgi:phosphatidylinositol 4-kinase B